MGGGYNRESDRETLARRRALARGVPDRRRADDPKERAEAPERPGGEP
jgi:hypothetical protein